MNGFLKKCLSLLLAVVMLFTVAVPALAQGETEDNYPIIFIGGKGNPLFDAEGNQIWPVEIDDGAYILEAAKEVVPLLTKAMVTGDYTEYADALNAKVSAVYEKLHLDGNGEASNGSYRTHGWSMETLKAAVKTNSPYQLYDFRFSDYYDWRLDPVVIAEQLNDYINDVLTVTGAEKVHIFARCFGGNITTAYLHKYGSDKLASVMMFETTTLGTVQCGALFAGEIFLEGDSIARFLKEALGDTTVMNLVNASIDLLNTTGGLTLPLAAISKIYDAIRDKVIPQILTSTFSTFPAYWAMVGDNYFEQAVDFTFAGREEEYKGLIEKIEYYHYEVMNNAESMLKELEAEGIPVGVMAKYGRQLVPLMKESNLLNDDTVELVSASFGATCATIGDTLSQEYIAAAAQNGTDSYIAYDKQVDASTCLFPHRTWFIKNSGHLDFYGDIDSLLYAFFKSGGEMDIYSNTDFPQYLVQLENLTFTPMTEDFTGDPEQEKPSFFTAFINFFRSLFAWLREVFGLNK